MIRFHSIRFVRHAFVMLLAVSGLLAFDLASAATEAAASAASPRLVVVVAVDQLRKDRLTTAMPGGLGRLLRSGRNFVDSSLDHGVTNTCPGHSVIVTGVQPGRAGIAGNDFVDNQSWQSRYCVADDNPDARVLNGEGGRSPRLLKVDTLGDWLKAEQPKARVFSVSGKDRAAVVMGGQHPDGVFWYNAKARQFTSSTYYQAALPDYVEKFNGPEGFLSGVPATWEHSAGQFRADDYPGESTKYQRTSGHPLNSGELDARGGQIYYSPFLDVATMALARTVVGREQLGQDAVPDLLTISLSANDNVGHLYGPFSAEAEATLAQIDQSLGEFMDYLDRNIGEDNYLLVLTADHGVADLPEWQLENKTARCPSPSGRLDLYPFMARLYGSVYWRETFPFDLPTDLIKILGNQVYINPAYVAAHQLDFSQIEADLKDHFESVDIIKQAWTQAEIVAGTTEEARLLRNSLVPGRSGDLMLQVYPDCVIRADNTGTTHGSLYDYDRAIPMLFYGAGVVPGNIAGAARSVDIAPTVAASLGLKFPADLDGKPLSLLTQTTDSVIKADHE